MQNTYLTLTGLLILSLSLFSGCKMDNNQTTSGQEMTIAEKLDQYIEVTLTTDVSILTENQKKMIPLLIEASKIMDEIFWTQAFGEKQILKSEVENDTIWKFAKINYGPWDRLNGNEPFIEEYGSKPAGANFYPPDMTKEEFESWKNDNKNSQYTLIRRKPDGSLTAIWYHEAYKDLIERATTLMLQAANLAEDEGFKNYIELRVQALLTDKYFDSDMAWMAMKNNMIDFVVGPIENYEDQLFGYKAAHEAFILVKDTAWSSRLLRYAELLPALQEGLPVPDEYKQEKPGTESDLGVYDAVYYAGDCNAGSKTIAINLPNDERVQAKMGSRRLQLKNSMRAKFDKILIPIANVLIVEDQQEYIQFDAFFENTMFHEVAHGLGIKKVLNKDITVREALKDNYSALEEGKADILGLFMVQSLHDMGELTGDPMNNYVTFMAGLFRSIRFGASSSHGKANLLRFNYFKEKGAFTKTKEGTYRVHPEKMKEAMNELSSKILILQGDGNYEDVVGFMDKYGSMDNELKADLEKLQHADIPVDIVFNQGIEILGL
ncbi:MAG: dipeptidyl-peptidase 3 family protein [Bacteroidales bacterium]